MVVSKDHLDLWSVVSLSWLHKFFTVGLNQFSVRYPNVFQNIKKMMKVISSWNHETVSSWMRLAAKSIMAFLPSAIRVPCWLNKESQKMGLHFCSLKKSEWQTTEAAGALLEFHKDRVCKQWSRQQSECCKHPLEPLHLLESSLQLSARLTDSVCRLC